MRTIVCGRWNKHSSARPEARELWATRNRYDSGKTVLQDVKEAEDLVVALLLRELEEAGVSMLGDGGIRWDSIYDILREIPGCDGFIQLTRIPETNHFHRQPYMSIERRGSKSLAPKPKEESVLARDFVFARARTALPLVMTIPGPYSCARQTENVSEVGLENAARFYAQHLKREIRFLLQNGVAMVRVEEPLIFSHAEDAPLFRELMRELTGGVDQSRVALASWFEDASNITDYFNLPFGIFFVDFVDGVKNIKVLREFPSDKQLVAGIFDASQTYEESKTELRQKLAEIRQYVPTNRLILSCNTDLDFLPWDEAMEKVRRMTQFAQTAQTLKKGSEKVISDRKSPRDDKPDDIHYLPSIRVVDDDQISSKGRGDVLQSKFSFGTYPTSTVGSFPQPEELRRARVLLRQQKMNEGEYRELVAKHTRDWMSFQEEVEITVPVSGEFIREDMAAYFGLHFGGRLLDFVPSYENRRYRPVEYSKRIRLERPEELADEFRFLQSLTSRPVKETITGPATLADWALIKNARYYKDRRSFRMDLAGALRKQIDCLVASGARVLQVDEPALTTKRKNLLMDLDAIHETIRGLEDRAYLILHICYSDMEALDEAFPYILELPFHQIHMEMANRDYSLMRLIEKYGFGGKDIGLGVVDVHTDRIETVEEIVAGVERTHQYFEPHQIWLTPDCGLKERSDGVAKQKLRNMARAAELCRNIVK